MQAYEFNLQASEKGELLFPPEIQRILRERRKARVIVLFDDEEAAWERLTMDTFLAGYSEKDAIYDNL
jgi:hypothetical protein